MSEPYKNDIGPNQPSTSPDVPSEILTAPFERPSVVELRANATDGSTDAMHREVRNEDRRTTSIFNSVSMIAFVMLTGFVYLLLHLIGVSEDLVQKTALEDAGRVSAAIEEFRTLYSSEVVSRAKAHGMTVTHDYQDRENAIPLPATLSMMLGRRLGDKNSDLATRLYSDYPFPWRKNAGPRDEFEHRALKELRREPNKPYYEFGTVNNLPVLRYATADLMRQSCIDCHNNHAQSPKTDWKVGDVRGVLSVNMPMTHAISQTHTAFEKASTMLAFTAVAVLLTFAFVLRRVNRQNMMVQKANAVLESKQAEIIHARHVVEESNAVLREKAQQLENARRAALNLMTDMERAKLAADAASQAKSNFLANMSHEIRTPMTAIIGFSDLLVDAETSPEDRQNAIHTINRNGKHLLGLINDILDLSRIESGKMEFEIAACRPVNLLEEVHEMLHVAAGEKELDLRLKIIRPIPKTIQTDALRIRQAVVNLVGNAIKFTKSGHVEMEASCDVDRELMQIVIRDSGIGMDEHQLNRIFEPFSQVDNSMTRRFGGTGLGLAITRNIARALGGDVVVESEIGTGSAFTLTFSTGELKDVEMQSVEDTKRPTPVARQKKATPKVEGTVLLVEDGPDNQKLVSFLLKKAGAAVTIANNGQEALEAVAKAGQFDLILMDMQMPVMDGYTATRMLRAQKYPGQIVALTAHALKEEVEKCLGCGCDAYLRKPIEKPVFFAEIQQRIGQPSAKQAPVEQVCVTD